MLLFADDLPISRERGRTGEDGNRISLIHEFSITGSIARQPPLMADQTCKCWFFFWYY